MILYLIQEDSDKSIYIIYLKINSPFLKKELQVKVFFWLNGKRNFLLLVITESIIFIEHCPSHLKNLDIKHEIEISQIVKINNKNDTRPNVTKIIKISDLSSFTKK
ncbi:hypothetical protein BpHYR1_048159 [Brachionus plicatilis]|uniref:Uncharacterized protein n=1 Tax=Brachionus plicatilis TaxID=10195 RepID=A0A3M7RZF0_BRAPC|nr:hypothetical protein BpHYR1_048159 [Brachionus plicatilis]